MIITYNLKLFILQKIMNAILLTLRNLYKILILCKNTQKLYLYIQTYIFISYLL